MPRSSASRSSGFESAAAIRSSIASGSPWICRRFALRFSMEKHSFLIARRKYRSSASSRAVAPDRSTDVNSTLVPAAGETYRAATTSLEFMSMVMVHPEVPLNSNGAGLGPRR